MNDEEKEIHIAYRIEKKKTHIYRAPDLYRDILFRLNYNISFGFIVTLDFSSPTLETMRLWFAG